MQAYKFNTRISERGIISLPYKPELFNTEVEIIILSTPQKKVKEKEDEYTVDDFIKEFSGCLKNLPENDSDDLKYEYLKRKYQLFSNDVSKEEIDDARSKYLAEKYK